MDSPYQQAKRTEGKPVRVVIQLPKNEVEAIDLWGVPVGMPSRAAAVRRLVQDGLAVAKPQLTTEAAQ